MFIIFLIILWWVVGALGFMFWWTSQYDLTRASCYLPVVAGIIGPLAWGLGAIIHKNDLVVRSYYDTNVSHFKVLVHKRSKEIKHG